MRAVSKVRLGAKLGMVPPELMKQVERRILLHLGIE
jgi:mRNA-degrading endonuclease toxin of MazEF toxin-antitoxin module